MKRYFYFLLLIFISSQLLAQIDFRKETIYFIMTTRFYDGDPSNNAPTEWCSYYPGNPNNANYSGPEDVTWRGDFKGLIQKLDYIKDLGFTAIWVTPIVQNRSPLDYHGYHAWDFEKVDPRYESTGATFEDLVEAVHAKGMKIVLDVVTNHAGRFGIKDLAEIKYNTDPTQSWGQDLNGNPLQDNPNWEYDGLTPNPDDGKIWSRANLAKLPAPYNSDLSAYNWPGTESYVNTSDPVWYHHSGNGFAQGYDDTTNLYLRALAGDTPDLNTSSQVVQDYLFNAYKRYIDMGVDAFRWDTFKHMSKADILALLDRFKAYKPDLFVFGEVAQKRHELHPIEEINPHWYTWRGAVGNSPGSGASVIDFFGHATFHNVFEDGGSFSGVQAAARYDHLYYDPSELVTWLDNHDFGPNNDWNRRYGGTDENLAACMNFMFTWRGIPAVYYGTESRFKAGAFADIHGASAINQSINETGRAYFGDEMANAPNHAIYQHIKKLNAIRKAVPALQNGTWEWKSAPGNAVAYRRISGSSEVIVGLAKDGGASFSISGVTNGVYRDAVTGRETTVSNGILTFSVNQGGSAGIYVLNGPGMIGESGAGFFEPCVANCDGFPTVSIEPFSDNYDAPVTVTMNATGGTGSKTIYYTLDGSEPTTQSMVYSAPFTVNQKTIVKAIAIDANNRTSELNGQRYSFELEKPDVTFTPSSGNYFDPIQVELTASKGTGPYQIYYTLDNSEPTVNSTLYSGPIPVANPMTIKSIAVDAMGEVSTVGTATYTFNIPDPIVTISPEPKNYLDPISVTFTTESPRQPVSVYYTTDGSTPTTASTLYSGAFTLSQETTVQYIGVDSEGRVSDVQSATYTFNAIPDIVVYFKKPAHWASTMKIHYWNAMPTGVLAPTIWEQSEDMVLECDDWYSYTFSGITSINMVFHDGNGNQTSDLSATQTAYYDGQWLTTPPSICVPVPNVNISPVGGSFPNGSKTITLSSNVNTIRYTTDGSTPTTTTGIVYNGPFSITGNNNSVTVRAVAIDDMGTLSPIATETYDFSDGLRIRWKPGTTCNNPSIYYWNINGGQNDPVGWTNQPSMTDIGDGWYEYYINATSSNIIFTCNSNPQSQDILNVTSDTCFTGVGNPATPIACPVDETIPCASVIRLENLIQQDEQVQAADSIIASNTIQTGTVVSYKAGTAIVLKPGFHAQAGSSFHAFIQACTPPVANLVAVDNTIQTETILEYEEQPSPAEFSDKLKLWQNEPNPFSVETNIRFYLPQSGLTELRIYDMNGRLVHREESVRQAGMHTVRWQPISAVSSGMMYYELVTPYDRAIQKMIWLKY